MESSKLAKLLIKAIATLRDHESKASRHGLVYMKQEENLAVSPPVAKPLDKREKSLMVNLDELLPNPYNRDIDKEKVASIKRAILTTAEIKPLVVTEIDRDGKPALMLTDGHHRYVALKELGYSKAPAVMSDERGVHTADKEKPDEVAKRKPNPAADKETEKINENKKEWENKPHDFKAAEWTHPNGHPRCVKCGREEYIGGKCAMPQAWYDKKIKEEPPIVLGKGADDTIGEPELIGLERDTEGKPKRAYFRVRTGKNTEETYSVDINTGRAEKVVGVPDGLESVEKGGPGSGSWEGPDSPRFAWQQATVEQEPAEGIHSQPEGEKPPEPFSHMGVEVRYEEKGYNPNNEVKHQKIEHAIKTGLSKIPEEHRSLVKGIVIDDDITDNVGSDGAPVFSQREIQETKNGKTVGGYANPRTGNIVFNGAGATTSFFTSGKGFGVFTNTVLHETAHLVARQLVVNRILDSADPRTSEMVREINASPREVTNDIFKGNERSSMSEAFCGLYRNYILNGSKLQTALPTTYGIMKDIVFKNKEYISKEQVDIEPLYIYYLESGTRVYAIEPIPELETEPTEKVTGAHEGIEPSYSITALSRDPKRGPRTQDLTGGSGGAHGQQGFNIPGGGPYRT